MNSLILVHIQYVSQFLKFINSGLIFPLCENSVKATLPELAGLLVLSPDSSLNQRAPAFRAREVYGMTLLLTSFPGPLRPLMLPSVTLIAFHPPRAINIETSGDETGPGRLSSVWRFHIHSLITNWRQYSNPVNNSSTKGAFHSTEISVRKFGNSTCPIERYIPIAQTRPAPLRVWLFVSRIQKLER